MIERARSLRTPIDLERNPFFVLELDAGARAVDVDRQGKRLLAELELGRASAAAFPSPFGRQKRDEAAVRAAMASLRDPRLRALYALFVPPRDRWSDADVDPAPAAAPHGYPELHDAVPARRSWLRALLRAPGERDGELP